MDTNNRKKKNQGSTIIIVVVAMAFVGILASVVLSMSVTNFQMKNVNREAKVNFYSAESVLDEIKTGLQNDYGEVLSETYTEIMKNYNDLSVDSRNYVFKQQFMKNYITRLGGTYSTGTEVKLDTYEVAYFEKYILKEHGSNVEISSGVPTLEWRLDGKKYENQYIKLSNFTVSFTDDKKYETSITTDFRMQVPNVKFDATGSIPPFTEYAVIADDQLKVDQLKGSIHGNVYAGDDGILVTGGSASLSIYANRVITKGTVASSEHGTLIINDTDGDAATDKAEIWAQNIETMFSATKGASMNLFGSFYIRDDLTLNAPESNVKLTGKYFGYGYSENQPKDSSSIIVNRINSTLDLSAIQDIFVAGRAYITPEEVGVASADPTENATVTGDPVRTGEAITTKASQVVYLLPKDSIVREVDGEEEIVGQNPVCFVGDEDAYALQNIKVNLEYELPFTKTDGGTYRLRDFITGTTTYVDRDATNVIVYYYPTFISDEVANEYFKLCYKDSTYKQMLDNLMKEFNTTILPPTNLDTSSGRKTYAGNALFSKADGTEGNFIMKENSVDASLPEQYRKESDNLAQQYDALCKKLVRSTEEYAPSDLKDTMYENLIVESDGADHSKGLLGILGTDRSIEQLVNAAGTYTLVNNRDTEAFVIADGTFSNDIPSDQARIVIATGDVIVKKDFRGLIISDGTVQIQDDAKITADPLNVFNIICNSQLKSVFRDFEMFGYYLTNEDYDTVNITDMITFDNWKKN